MITSKTKKSKVFLNSNTKPRKLQFLGHKNYKSQLNSLWTTQFCFEPPEGTYIWSQY